MVEEIKVLLNQLSRADLGSLSDQDLNKIRKSLFSWKETLERTEARSRLVGFENTISPAEMPYYRFIMKSFKGNKPGARASVEEIHAYRQSVENLWQESSRKRIRYGKLLQEFKETDTANSLLSLSRMTPEELKELGEYAGLTEKTPNGPKKLSPGKTRKGWEKWLRELRKTSLSGYIK